MGQTARTFIKGAAPHKRVGKEQSLVITAGTFCVFSHGGAAVGLCFPVFRFSGKSVAGEAAKNSGFGDPRGVVRNDALSGHTAHEPSVQDAVVYSGALYILPQVVRQEGQQRMDLTAQGELQIPCTPHDEEPRWHSHLCGREKDM